MAKRKRQLEAAEESVGNVTKARRKTEQQDGSNFSVQIIVGSYERVLHGITATIPPALESDSVEFADNFIFHAHSSAIKCLALSPPSEGDSAGQIQRRILASGGTDEKINLYHISTSLPHPDDTIPLLPSLSIHKIAENPKNREIGSLVHHSSAVTALCFPVKSKLLSSAEDNTVALTRTRDWTVLSTIKAPMPKTHGRPSGDTAPHGGAPAGINDFAVHPSLKLMLSVGKGEKCMRLWNLTTGKKAGVLDFNKSILRGLGEGKWSGGEGRKVAWNHEGDEFLVGFERGLVIFGLDSVPQRRILPKPPTKLHQMKYLSINAADSSDLIVISTEDGRIIFYPSRQISEPPEKEPLDTDVLRGVKPLAQVGGHVVGLTSRVKDFEVIKYSRHTSTGEDQVQVLLVTGSSDGAVRMWSLDTRDLKEDSNSAGDVAVAASVATSNDDAHDSSHSNGVSKDPVRQIGKLLGTYDTANRITCLEAFTLSVQSVQNGSTNSPAVDGDTSLDESSSSDHEK
ncbi:MAG: hypothetical protein M1825_000324 [Sarcosagium campestre]|nr:MAG: hypothetical protein M1825_000324 [Sarcosagium campestre]